MEEKIILASLLRRFHVKSLDKPENVAILTDVILRPRDGIRMLLTNKYIVNNQLEYYAAY